MADDEILKRVDEHMARGNELMERIEEEFRLNREFMRELTVRNERVWRDMSSEIKGLGEAALEAVRELADLREASRAQRGALLRMIDRLPPPQQA